MICNAVRHGQMPFAQHVWINIRFIVYKYTLFLTLRQAIVHLYTICSAIFVSSRLVHRHLLLFCNFRGNNGADVRTCTPDFIVWWHFKLELANIFCFQSYMVADASHGWEHVHLILWHGCRFEPWVGTHASDFIAWLQLFCCTHHHIYLLRLHVPIFERNLQACPHIKARCSRILWQPATIHIKIAAMFSHLG